MDRKISAIILAVILIAQAVAGSIITQSAQLGVGPVAVTWLGVVVAGLTVAAHVIPNVFAQPDAKP